MRKPWIGIPTRYDSDKKRYWQDQRYLDAVVSVGGAPILIPVLGESDLIRDYADRLDGVLLPGSPTDIDPSHYGHEPHEKLGSIFAERDRMDFLLLDIAEHRKLPVLGICYGAQSLNVFRGGSLVQDIPSQIPDAVAHEGDGQPEEVRSHSVASGKGQSARAGSGSFPGRCQQLSSPISRRSRSSPACHRKGS